MWQNMEKLYPKFEKYKKIREMLFKEQSFATEYFLHVNTNFPAAKHFLNTSRI